MVLDACVQDCMLDYERRICRACGRTLEEISAWALMTDEEKKGIITRIKSTTCYLSSSDKGS